MAIFSTTGSDTYPSHHIVQVVSGTYTTETSTNSTSYVSINSALEPSITVTGSNKVWMMFNAPTYHGSASAHIAIQIFRDSTALGPSTWAFGSTHNGGDSILSTLSGNYLDTPGAGAHTYRLYHKTNTGVGYTCINTTRSTISLFEVSV